MERDSRILYSRLLGHVAPYWRIFALSILSMVVLALTEPAIAAILKPTLDGTFVDKNVDTLGTMALVLVGLFFVRGVSAFTSSVCLAWVGHKLVMDLRVAVFDKLTCLPARYFDRTTTGSLISKVTFDAGQVAEAGTHVLTVLIRDSLAIIGLLAWMVYLNWKLTLVFLIAAPFVVAIVRYFSSRLRQMSKNLQTSMGEVTHVLDETISGQRIVRTFGGQAQERERFTSGVNRARQFQVKFASAAHAVAPIAQFVTAVALAVLLYIAGRQFVEGEISPGTFMSFFAAMAMLFSPLKRLTSVNGPLQRGLAAADSVFGMIDEPAEADEGTRTIGRSSGHLEFRNVSFAYEQGKTGGVEHLSFVIEPGETIALVGPSGGGKSTLVNLIPRFYVPDSGQILLDGVDTKTLTLASLRRQIGLVSQDVVIFNDTVRNNIAYGSLAGADDSEVVKAAEAAHAREFIDKLPRGFDTVLGQRGVGLSGGQRQRIAIARAFLKDAPLLILDEATSSLDSESERHIQEALEELRRGRTTIVIAHRLSTIEWADRILVMSGGRIVESGTHEKLLEINNLYAGLYHIQFARQAEPLSAAGAE
ncbi:MAG TPA: lipid A export permease/ATP-binding protein MsbA [Gammaproteobacteria bacterium]|nr:lipid A export permease/ATP-binding protein MsbA [Gammaproteobacteria bacterium]